MRYLISLLLLVLVGSGSFAQGEHEFAVELTVESTGEGFEDLRFGTTEALIGGCRHSDMHTDGSCELPPAPRPPEGAFDARLVMPDGEETFINDVRDPSEHVEWTIDFQFENGEDMVFNWSFPAETLVPASGTLMLGQSDGEAVDMTETSRYEADRSQPSTVEITYDAREEQEVIEYTFTAGWNMVSLPLEVDDSHYKTLFPEATDGSLVTWEDDQYQQKEHLEPARGYWLHFDEEQTYTVEGEPVTHVTWSLSGGWNLVGGPAGCAPNTQSANPFLNVFGWSGSYTTTMGLTPGEGYWWHGGGETTVDCDGDNDYFDDPDIEAKRFLAVGSPPAPPSMSIIERPDRFVLHGNYPNPFNPATTVSFDLPEQAQVTVRVMDLQGRQVREIQQTFDAGSHEIPVDAGDLTSGVYPYQVIARMLTQTSIHTGRMTLVK